MSSLASLKNNFQALLARIRQDYPDISFEPDETFRWSSKDRIVYYNPDAENAAWSLLHELGHMLEGHQGYKTDRKLVLIEVEAWSRAEELALHYDCPIDPDYIQDCLDSYRYWQHERSTCPRCSQTGVEQTSGNYHCINCQKDWQVTPNRFCRVYRKQKLGADK
jgi:hypothetical protein